MPPPRPGPRSQPTSELVSGPRNRVRHVGALVNQLMNSRGYARSLTDQHLQASLVAVVGDVLGRSARVGNLRSGVLQVFAEDSVSLHELSLRRRDILRRLQLDHPGSTISELRFRVAASGGN